MQGLPIFLQFIPLFHFSHFYISPTEALRYAHKRNSIIGIQILRKSQEKQQIHACLWEEEHTSLNYYVNNPVNHVLKTHAEDVSCLEMFFKLYRCSHRRYFLTCGIFLPLCTAFGSVYIWIHNGLNWLVTDVNSLQITFFFLSLLFLLSAMYWYTVALQ